MPDWRLYFPVFKALVWNLGKWNSLLAVMLTRKVTTEQCFHTQKGASEIDAHHKIL